MTTQGPNAARAMVAAIGCISCVGIAMGLSLPLLAVTLDRTMGVPGVLNGLSGAMPALAGILIGPLITPIVLRIGFLRLMASSLVLILICTASYPLFFNVWAWMPIRFASGLGMGILFAACEFWISHNASDSSRGRILGIYAAVFTAAFAVGPGLLALTGYQGILPYIIAGIAILAAFPFCLYGRGAEPRTLKQDAPQPFLAIARRAPQAMIIGAAYGAVESGGFSFLVIHAIRHDLDEASASALLVSLCIGSLILSPLIGALSDRCGRRRVLILCSIVNVAAASLIPAALSSPAAIHLLMVFWGGAVVGLYTGALALMSDRLRGVDLLSVNAAFSTAYAVGALFGPLWFGLCLDVLPQQQIPIGLTVLAVAVAFFMIKKEKPQTSPQ